MATNIEKLFGPDMPAIVPPPGLTSNFDNPQETLYGLKLGVSIAVVILTTTVVAIRAITSSKLIEQWYAEDYACMLSFLFLLSGMVIGLQEPFSTHVSAHMWDVRVTDMPLILYNIVNVQMVWCPGMLFAKLAILLQLRRLFCVNGIRDPFSICVHTSMTFITLFNTVSLCVFWFRCNLQDKAWNTLKDGKCTDQFDLIVATGVANAVSDYTTLSLFAWVVANTNLSIGRNLGAIAMFGVGIFTCILGTIGVWIRASLFHTTDLTYSLCKMDVIAGAEIALIICVGCAPSVPRLDYLLHRSEDDEKRAQMQHTALRNVPNTAENKEMESNTLNSLPKYMGSEEGRGLFNDREMRRRGGL